jgi:hypothetical protein
VAVVTDQPVFNNPEGFESSPGTNDWAVDAGTWEIGKPTSGPGQGHLSTNCAATVLAGNYATNADSRLISPPFLVPSNSPALRFYHWYNFKSALGFVETSTDGGSTWNQISSTYQNGNTGNMWNNVSVDLSAYAGQTVQVAFRFASIGISTAAGWYVDDISLVASPILNVPPTQTIYAGQTPDFPLSASLFPTNDTPRFALVSATNVVLDTNTGVLTWTNTAPLVPSTNKITVKVTDTNLQLSATASFIIQVLQPLVFLTVPPTQTNYAGQKLDVTISATNYASPGDLLIFATKPPTPANVLIDPYTGELTWTPTAAQKGPNTITVTVTDGYAQLSATTNFTVVVSTNPPPPTLTVPPTQKIYAGQTLIVSNTATSVFPNSTFTFTQISGPTNNVVLNATNGVLIWIWATTTNQPAENTNVTIKVTDSVSSFSATNHFAVVVSRNPPPPMLIVPSTQTIYAGQTLIVTNNAYYTNSVFIGSSAFTFVTNPPTPAGVILIPTNGVLTWATPVAQPAGTYTNAITVTDSLSGFSTASNFLVQVLPPHPPTIIVPPTQLIYAGQTMDVTISATNSAYTNCSFTYVVFATNGPPYLDESDLPTDGVLKWTPTAAQAPNIYTIVVGVTENNSLSAISNFLVLVAMPPPPTLIVPPTQTIYAGQTLVVTISATNSILPNSTYTFGIVSAPAKVIINPTSGVLTWTNTASTAPSTNTITVNVTDNSTLLGATNSFIVRLLLPMLKIAAGTQPAKGSFQLAFSAGPNTTWRIDASTNLLNWPPLLTNTAGPSGTIQFTDLLATNYLRRFYRAVLQ